MMNGPGQKNTLYVGGLAEEVDDKILHAAFVPFGDIKDVKIPLDLATNKNRIEPTSHVTLNIPDEKFRLHQPLLPPPPSENVPDPLDAAINVNVPVQFAKFETRQGFILLTIACTLIPAFFELIYNTTCHVKPLIVIFAVTSYVSLLVITWHKMRFLRAEPDDGIVVYLCAYLFIIQVVFYWILVASLSLTLHSTIYVVEIFWTAIGFVIMSCLVLNYKFYL